MATAETARLIASLELKDLFSKGIGNAQKSLSKFDKSIDHTQSKAFQAGQHIGIGIRNGAYIAASAIGFLATNVGLGLHSLSLLDDVVTQSNAVLKSTKGVAGQTAESIRDLANKYEDLNATVDDTIIQSGENLLLTFTNIRQKAFEPALAAALDMNKALGRSPDQLTDTVRVLGKALNDPAKGLTALGRVGITFTKGQKDQIAAALKANDTYKAQSIILAELNKRFGGSFLAGGGTTAGKVAKFKDAIDDLQRALATALLPVIGKVSDRLSAFLKDPKVVAEVTKLGEAIAGLFSDKNLAEGGKVLGTLFDTAKAAAPVLKAAASSMLDVVKAAVGLFRSLPEGMQQLAVGAFAINKLTGGLITNLGGALAGQLLQRGSSPVNPLFVADVTGGLGGAAGVGGILGESRWAMMARGIGGAVITGLTTVVLPALAGLFVAGQIAGVGPFAPNAGHTFTRHIFDPNATDIRNNTGRGTTTTLFGAVDRIAKSLADVIRTMTHEFGDAVRSLVKARKPEDVQKSVAAVLALVIGKGRGSAGATAEVLADLRKQLGHTHDAKTAAILRSAIRQVEAKIPGRVYAQKQVDAVNGMLKDGKLTTAELRKIKGIEQALKDHGLPSAAAKIQARVDAAKDKIAAQTLVLRHKKFSPTIVVPVTSQATTIINGRSFTGNINRQTILVRAGQASVPS